MRWRGNRRSQNVDDLRGDHFSGGMPAGGGVLRLLPLLLRVLGFKGTALVVLGFMAYGFFTGNLDGLLGGAPTVAPASHSGVVSQSSEEQELVEFVSVILADTEDTWGLLFQQMQRQYQPPRLVLFRGQVRSACGTAQSAMGPFYCPGDHKVYIDLGFYAELQNRFKAPGDFAQAYVIAHEVGHHVQTLLGISQKVHKAQAQMDQKAANQLSVKLELQADCFAGVWAYHANQARQLLEAGDIEEGLRAASAIGDDALQRQATGVVRPDSFTHGSSAQRVQWFKTGLDKGQVDSCNTFG